MITDFLETATYPSKSLTTLLDLEPYTNLLISCIMLQLDKKEIANILMCKTMLLDEFASTRYNMSFESLEDTFKSRGKQLLLDQQFEKALTGSEKMLQFLGKNYLGQSDNGDKALLNAEQIVFIDNISKDTSEN